MISISYYIFESRTRTAGKLVGLGALGAAGYGLYHASQGEGGLSKSVSNLIGRKEDGSPSTPPTEQLKPSTPPSSTLPIPSESKKSSDPIGDWFKRRSAMADSKEANKKGFPIGSEEDHYVNPKGPQDQDADAVSQQKQLEAMRMRRLREIEKQYEIDDNARHSQPKKSWDPIGNWFKRRSASK